MKMISSFWISIFQQFRSAARQCYRRACFSFHGTRISLASRVVVRGDKKANSIDRGRRWTPCCGELSIDLGLRMPPCDLHKLRLQYRSVQHRKKHRHSADQFESKKEQEKIYKCRGVVALSICFFRQFSSLIQFNANANNEWEEREKTSDITTIWLVCLSATAAAATADDEVRRRLDADTHTRRQERIEWIN